jgi:UDP-3-O-[3-hydroxymyristoyl] glucosamine N-acyltransferase
VIDPKFYEVSGPLKASDIAELTGGTLIRGDAARTVSSVSSSVNARTGDLTFLDNDDGNLTALSGAGVVIAPAGIAKLIPKGPAIIETPHPRAAFVRAAQKLVRLRQFEQGAPAIHAEARIAASARIEPGVVIGQGAAIGAEAHIGANAVIGPGVQIGARTFIGAGAVIRCALIGDGVSIFAGAVVGESGFGLAAAKDGAALSPHFGRVIMQNGVTLGANSCIDRGLFDDTVIGEGAHIDNLCHIGHNCRIGSHVVMAAFAGVSGSSEVGDGVQFGGRVGLKDHVRVGTGARIAAGAAVLSDVPAGETWAGYPAKPIRVWMRELAWLGRAAQKRSAKEE